MVDSGELQDLLDDMVRGATSNPSSFEKAISDSADYDDRIHALVALDKTDEQICETLILEYIQGTVDLLRPIYYETDGLDSYVSPEVQPHLSVRHRRHAGRCPASIR